MNGLRLAHILVAATLWTACPVAAARETQDPPDDRSAFQVEDVPALLVPKRTEEQSDRITASALYAQGRMLLQRQKFSTALRRFQRAWRYDPQLVDLMSEVIPLAVNLGREPEVTRYAVIAAEHDTPDISLVSRVAAVVSQNEDWPRALRLFQRELELRAEGPRDAALLALHFELGRHYFLTGQFEQSAAAFAVVRQGLDDPSSFSLSPAEKRRILGRAHLTYNLLAEAFLRAKRYDESDAMFRRSDQARPNEPLLMLHLARVDAARERQDDALEKLDRYFAAQSDEGGVQPYVLLAELIEPGPQPKPEGPLINRLTELRTEHPDSKTLATFLADTLSQAGNLDEAAEAYRQLIDDGPTANAFLGLAEVYRRQADDQRLVELLGQVVELTGSLRTVDDVVGRILEEPAVAGRVISGSQKRLAAGESLPPETLFALASLAQQAGVESAAEQLMAAATAEGQEADEGWIVNWGLGWLTRDKPALAVDGLRRALELEMPDDARAELYYYLAGALEMTDRTDDALAAARKAADLQPDSILHAGRLPWVLFHARRLDDAKREYLAIVERFDDEYDSPNHRDVLRDVRFVLSSLCADQGDLPEAEEWLEQVLDEFPEDVGAMNDLGYLWCDANQHLVRSLKMIRRAVAEEPDNVAYLDSLGWVYYRLERFDEAVAELEKAVAADLSPDGVILDHLGDAYFKAGDTSRALATWKKAVDAFRENSNSDRADKALEKINQHSVSN